MHHDLQGEFGLEDPSTTNSIFYKRIQPTVMNSCTNCGVKRKEKVDSELTY